MRKAMRTLGFFGLFLMMLMVAMPVMAQNRIIKGKVTDDRGQPLAGVTVTIRAVDSKNIAFTAKTDKRGEYLYIALPAGDYYVIARAQGYSPSYSGARPTLSQDTVVNLALTPGPDGKLPFEMTQQEIDQAKRELEKFEKRKQSSAEVQSLFDAGLQLAKQEKHPEAIEEFKKALEKDPEQGNIMGYMAESYLKLGKDAEALELYRKAVTVQPNDAALHTNLGVLLGKLGKSEESKEAFAKAASLNPGASAQTYYNMGATLFNSGNTAEAAEAFKKAIAADPTFAEAYFQLGMSLSGNPDMEGEAIKALQQYIKIGEKADQVGIAKELIKALEDAKKK
jgi:tetratricopeptide (TPR) repeat protein